MTIRSATSRGVTLRLVLACLSVAAGAAAGAAQDAPELVPTLHPSLPSSPSELWLVPSDKDRAARTLATYEPLVAGVARFQAGDYTAAMPLLSRPGLSASALADYATYYIGLSQLRQGKAAEARRTFESLIDRKPVGFLSVGAAMAAGEAAETSGDPTAAVKFYERAAEQKGAVTEDVLYRIGRAALAAGDRKKAADALVRVYYEFPLTEAATLAAAQLPSLEDQLTRKNYKLDVARAQLLFGARRYTEARSAFQTLQSNVSGDDREVADLRVAECDFYLKRYAAARDAVRPYLDRASRQAEARFFYLSSLRELGQHAEYIALTTALVADFPDSSWSEEALNNLGTHYILTNEDALATKTFRQMYEQFPTGQRAERAAWKYGWASYRNGDYAETVRVFESAALAFPRSDYRPPFLYWAARAHAKLDAAALADARLRLVYTDYANSYYGRLAERQLARLGKPADGGAVRLASRDATPAAAAAPAPPPLPTDATIRLLLANGLYEDALGELRFAQRAWGNAPRLDATIAWVYHEKGELRRAISLMRRAYPQHLTAGGEELPTEILQVIYPIAYWDAIRRNAAAQGLDPYVVAALIGQESTFDPGVKSVANAWGLMQIVPATGRRLAKSLGVRKFTTDSLTNADPNIRLGTLYFSRLVAAVRRDPLCPGELQRRRKPHRPLEGRAPRAGRGRVHRRHSFSGNAELREADSGDRGGLPDAVRPWRGRRGAGAPPGRGRAGGPEAVGEETGGQPAGREKASRKKEEPDAPHPAPAALSDDSPFRET